MCDLTPTHPRKHHTDIYVSAGPQPLPGCSPMSIPVCTSTRTRPPPSPHLWYTPTPHPPHTHMHFFPHAPTSSTYSHLTTTEKGLPHIHSHTPPKHTPSPPCPSHTMARCCPLNSPELRVPEQFPQCKHPAWPLGPSGVQCHGFCSGAECPPVKKGLSHSGA